MRTENIADYRLNREEMRDIKNCITSYMGYTFGGAGLLAGMLVFINESSENRLEKILTLSNGICGVSFVISLVLLILFYKFNSHNFHAGYCKLLNKEGWHYLDDPQNQPPGLHFKHEKDVDLMVWEWCIGELRKIDTNPGELIRILEKDLDEQVFRAGAGESDLGREELIEQIERFSMRFVLKRPNETRKTELQRSDFGTAEWGKLLTLCVAKEGRANDWKRVRGVRLLCDALLLKISRYSWTFPIMVTLCYLVLFVVLGISCMSMLITAGASGEEIGLNYFASSILIFTITSLLQIYFWSYFCGKLFALTLGDASIEAYYWRFIPVRSYVLKRNGIALRRV